MNGGPEVTHIGWWTWDQILEPWFLSQRWVCKPSSKSSSQTCYNQAGHESTSAKTSVSISYFLPLMGIIGYMYWEWLPFSKLSIALLHLIIGMLFLVSINQMFWFLSLRQQSERKCCLNMLLAQSCERYSRCAGREGGLLQVRDRGAL